MLGVQSDEFYMKKALEQAQIAFEKGEVPVGAVVVCQGQIIAKAHNQVEQLGDVTAHAEMLAITSAADYLGNKYLKDCSLYVTLEPCVMCGGALFWSQLDRVVIGARDDKRGFSKVSKNIIHPKSEVIFDVMGDESVRLINEFFAQLRK